MKKLDHNLNLIMTFAFLFIWLYSCNNEDEVSPSEGDNEGYNQYGTPFDNTPEIEDMVFYEVNLRAFSNSGDLQGVIDRLDEIKALSVNVIWLMPIHPIGEINSVNSPYSVKNYKEVNPEFGTLTDLRKLIEEAHLLDMAVVLDWVANHTAWDNPWISDKSWYTQDGNGNIVHPPGTNWQDVADLNFDKQDMRLEMIDAMKYWVLEANVDGFRCDAADFVPFDFWQQAIDSLNSVPDREIIYLAEGARADHFEAGFQLNYSWEFYNKMKSVFSGQETTGLFSIHNVEYYFIPEGKHKLRFTTNHDESAWDATPMVIFNGKEGALVASVINTFLGGVPLIFGSQEVGRVTNVPFFSNSPINWNENPDMLQAYKNFMGVYAQSDVAKKGSILRYNHPDVVLFKKQYDDQELVIIANVREYGFDLQLPDSLQNTSWSDAITNDTVSLGTTIQLNGYEYFILKN